jgi:hypothetical protein
VWGKQKMLIKLLFKKPESYPDDVKALIDVSVSLRLRMDKLVNCYDIDQAGSLAA